jgi:hypothetical protein
MGTTGSVLNLHTSTIRNKYHLEEWSANRKHSISALLECLKNPITHKDLVKISTTLYESGYSCLDLVDWFRVTDILSEKDKSAVVLCFHKIKSEFRCEKLLMLYLFDYAFLRPNKDLKNIGFI